MPYPAMAMPVLVSGTFAPNGTTPAVFYPAFPCRLLSARYVASTASDATQVVDVDITELDASATSPSGAHDDADVGLGTFTLTTTNAAVNQAVEKNFQAEGNDRIIYPGESVRFTSDGAGAAGQGVLWMLIEPLGDADVDMRSHVTGHPGSTTQATARASVTVVTS